MTTKKIFWCTRILDVDLGVMLGKSAHADIQAIDQGCATFSETAQFGLNAPVQRRLHTISTTAASGSHAQLASIILKAIRAIRSIHGGSPTGKMAALTSELDIWKAGLPSMFSSEINPSALLPIFRRQHFTLSLGYCYALMVVNRLAPLDYSDSPETAKYFLRSCVSAAANALNIVLEMIVCGKLQSYCWFAQLVARDAVATVYLWASRSISGINPVIEGLRSFDLTLAGKRGTPISESGISPE